MAGRGVDGVMVPSHVALLAVIRHDASAEGTHPGPRRSVSISVELVAVEHGVWCDACALSSAATATVAVTIGRTTTLQNRIVCGGEHT